MSQRRLTARRVGGHDVHVRFGDRVHSALGEFANRSGLALNGSVRLLVERGLALEDVGSLAGSEAQQARHFKTLAETALAILIAVEQNQRLLVSMLPQGEEFAEQLWEDAASSARQRLIKVDRLLAEESA